MTKRGNVGVVVGRDRDSVADGEAVELAARAPVPCRLMRLAQARQIEAKALAPLIKDAVPARP